MTISAMEEYKTLLEETISIQLNNETKIWEVACWDKDDQSRWYKEFSSEEKARNEYDRWKTK